MEYRKFGKTDMVVSALGFGAWAIGGAAQVGKMPIGWGATDDNTSTLAIKAALDAGINFFDTADFYGFGHSEELLGKIIGADPKIIMATKVGQRKNGETVAAEYSYDYIIKACEQSLGRLKRETIDYYQLHTARVEHLQQGDCIRAMEQLKQEGKIRYWGISLLTYQPQPEADYMISNSLGDGFQLVFNIINQRAASVIEKAAAAGYGIIARMPLQFGLLTGRITETTVFEDTDHRKFRLTKEILQATLSLLEKEVWPVSESENISKLALALRFILSFPEIATAIAGMRTPAQVEMNKAALGSLTQKQKERLQHLAQTHWPQILELMEKQG